MDNPNDLVTAVTIFALLVAIEEARKRSGISIELADLHQVVLSSSAQERSLALDILQSVLRNPVPRD